MHKTKLTGKLEKDRYAIQIVLAALVWLGPVISSLAADAEQQNSSPTAGNGRPTIKSIEFEGNESFKNKTLRKKLDFEVGDFLDPVLAESGRRILEEYYLNKGFADAQVTLDKAMLYEGKILYTIKEGPRYKIKSIHFKGNKELSNSTLRDAIKTGTHKWFFWPVYYTQEKIAEDLEKLRTLYYQRGFLNYKIEVSGRTNITFDIEEGPRYDVNEIIVTGNEYFSREKLLEGLELRRRGIYYQQQAASQVERIKELYGENGFINPQVQQQVLFVPGENAVDVKFIINEGRQFRIGRIDITGNENTQDKVIRRVLDEYDFLPGELYNSNLAPIQGGGKLEKYVQSMTMAEQAIIKPVEPEGGSEDQIDVKVDIEEGLTGMLSPGIAIGSDSGVVGQFIWEQRNFDITDWPENLSELLTMDAFKGAGQTLSVRLMPGTEISTYSVVFTEPYLYDKPTSLNVIGSSYERWQESYDEKRTKGFVKFQKRYKDHWTRSVGFRVENVGVDNLDYDAPWEIYDVKGDNMLYGISFGFGRDMRDDRFNPSEGYIYEVEYQQVTGDHTFGILEGNWIGFKTIYKDLQDRKTVLAMKLLAGTTVSDAPPFEKYYAGGTGLYGISGFDYRGVSTRGRQSHVLPLFGIIPRKIDPIGSDYIFLADAEVTIPLVGENIGGLVFIDSGTIDSGRYRASLGTGIQIKIPQLLGSEIPMRFEIAWPFSKDDSDDTRAFSFTMGTLF
jgi:outer membrane protein insertion porin family